MKRKILRGWNWVRRVWLLMGTAIAIGAIVQHNYLLLLPALYFVIGAIANVGCFAQSCAVDHDNNQVPDKSSS